MVLPAPPLSDLSMLALLVRYDACLPGKAKGLEYRPRTVELLADQDLANNTS